MRKGSPRTTDQNREASPSLPNKQVCPSLWGIAYPIGAVQTPPTKRVIYTTGLGLA
jgi:hypothetical protein